MPTPPVEPFDQFLDTFINAIELAVSGDAPEGRRRLQFGLWDAQKDAATVAECYRSALLRYLARYVQ